MGPPRSNTSKKVPPKGDGKKNKKNSSSPTPRRKPQAQVQQNKPESDENQIEISSTIPLSLQQLVLDVFKFALLVSQHASKKIESGSESMTPLQGAGEIVGECSYTSDPREPVIEEEELDIKSLIQTIKSHLYNRDFDSAFTDANEELLRAYALRWSAARALGYAGVFKSLFKVLITDRLCSDTGPNHVVCIGGGAGAEIVALAAAWRGLIDEAGSIGKSTKDEAELPDTLDAVSLDDKDMLTRGVSITAVDIADWSSVVDRLSSAIQSPLVPASKSHPAPLYPGAGSIRDMNESGNATGFAVGFKHLDVLSAPENNLRELFQVNTVSGASTVMVTLMFTLNELFSTSMAKATAFLLRTTDLLQPGTLLLVVDSPGSYSTLKLGRSAKSPEGSGQSTQERQYPMKFLLDHTLSSIAKGKWQRIYSQDSRWWRRDATRLRYDVGEGAGLEDMRFQVHIYRRLG